MQQRVCWKAEILCLISRSGCFLRRTPVILSEADDFGGEISDDVATCLTERNLTEKL